MSKRRGRPEPDYSIYSCAGCGTDKPTIRDGVHVPCKCGAAPNPSLAKLHDLPDWPRVVSGVSNP